MSKAIRQRRYPKGTSVGRTPSDRADRRDSGTPPGVTEGGTAVRCQDIKQTLKGRGVCLFSVTAPADLKHRHGTAFLPFQAPSSQKCKKCRQKFELSVEIFREKYYNQYDRRVSGSFGAFCFPEIFDVCPCGRYAKGVQNDLHKRGRDDVPCRKGCKA